MELDTPRARFEVRYVFDFVMCLLLCLFVYVLLEYENSDIVRGTRGTVLLVAYSARINKTDLNPTQDHRARRKP